MVDKCLTAEDERAIKAAQEVSLEQIIDRDIDIETNPTSNYRIGPFEDFEDISTLTMLGLSPEKRYYHGLRISIGTDDTGLFGIDLHNEYASILYSLQQQGTVKGNDLIEVMRILARTSLELSFDK